MKKILVNDTEYTLEYSFSAAEHKETVQHMFNVASGAYIIKKATSVDVTENEDENNLKAAEAMLDGTAEMVSDIPHIVKTAFYSGLLENHGVSEKEAYEIMKAYMKENKISFKKLFDDIKKCMEDDGFFDLSGLTDMLREMNKASDSRETKKVAKIPQDHKKKQTSTK